MKWRVLIGVLIFQFSLMAQQWRSDLAKARLAYKKGNYVEALKRYSALEKKVPKNIDISAEMAQAVYKTQNFEEAEKLFDKSKTKLSKSDRAKYYHNVGNSRMQQKKYGEAINSYKNSLKNNPQDEETRYNLSEAIRRLKKQQNQDKSKNNPPKNQDNKQKNKQNNQNKKNEKQKKQEEKQQNSKLPEKAVDKMLDQLAKQEAETKRKAKEQKGDRSGVESGKDW